MRTRRLNVNVIGAICALTVCSARVGHAQGSSDRCGLLTQAAVSAAAGVSVDAGKPIATTGCSWQSQKPHVVVSVSFPAGMEKLFTGDNQFVTKTHVGGIGDDAVYVTAAPLTTLYVKHGKDIVMVRVYGVPDEGKQKSIEKTLALDVLKKL